VSGSARCDGRLRSRCLDRRRYGDGIGIGAASQSLQAVRRATISGEGRDRCRRARQEARAARSAGRCEAGGIGAGLRRQFAAGAGFRYVRLRGRRNGRGVGAAAGALPARAPAAWCACRQVEVPAARGRRRDRLDSCACARAALNGISSGSANSAAIFNLFGAWSRPLFLTGRPVHPWSPGRVRTCRGTRRRRSARSDGRVSRKSRSAGAAADITVRSHMLVAPRRCRWSRAR
jgi:hypothetical protein